MALRKLNTKNKSPKKIIIAAAIAALLVVAGVAAYFFFIQKSDNANTSSTSDSAKDVAENIKKNSPNNSSVKQDDGETNNAAEVPQTDGTLSDSVSIAISSFSQGNGVVAASANVTGSTGGTCYFIFSTQDAKPINRSTALSGSACSTSIPEVEFSKLGTWKLTVSYVNGSKNKEVSQNVTIK